MDIDEQAIAESVQSFKEHATHPMNPDAKRALVEGLRSGKYAQTNGYLFLKEDLEFTKAGFCCLGVLSKVAIENNVGTVTCAPSRLNPKIMEFKSGTDEYRYDSSTAFLIDEVADWAEFPDNIVSDLMSINDNGGSFALIADLIEEHL